MSIGRSDAQQQPLAGRVALVSGGSRGIGRAIVENLVGQGVQVCFFGRDRASVDALANELGCPDAVLARVADVTDEAAMKAIVQETVARFAGLDILINNAGIGLFKAAGEMSVAEFRRVIDVNLVGAFQLTRAALDFLRDRRGRQASAHVVNISSLAGKNAFAGGAAYNASKFGLDGMTEAMMLDHRYDDVRISLICPGSVDTEFSGRETTRAAANDWKIQPGDVAEAVMSVLRMPERSLISRVELRPAKPKRH